MRDYTLLARQILEDLREEVDEETLRNKYNLAPESLLNILLTLEEQGLIFKIDGRFIAPDMRSISAIDMVRDIQNGMDEAKLQEKYGLSLQGLASSIRLLVEGNHLTRSDLAERDLLFQEVMDPGLARESRRYYLDFDLPIFDMGTPMLRGRVNDLTEKGLGTIGIPSRPDEIKHFMINHEKFVLLKPFAFQARCRWSRQNAASGDFIAGFEISEISPEDFAELRKLCKMVTFYVSPETPVKFGS
ncbi:PilZ domain-containing protein [Desulfomonile tiedjei]|uniref:PilZ domain-containing protein n=1 Tax=Desulfomonile tiedjei (strain ATCC 49306 / DSM 6799 / DCB-1) TaxID=706587 RepID=I4C0Y1_DESTA|nr:PilZ domain-containing protein [Desulfomonile tiedjei]AFM23222.1 hypothetical protein Desti_0488 [Desulfomonile tiedjei DSM 6799]